jgi:hypothetical protein
VKKDKTQDYVLCINKRGKKGLYQLLHKAGFVHREGRTEESNHRPVRKRKGMNPLAAITNKDEIGALIWRVEDGRRICVMENDKKKLGTTSL